MKILTKSKYFIFGLLIGVGLMSIGVFATTTQPGAIGSLFEKIGLSYKLRGDEIKDHTIDNSEIENNADYRIGKLGISTDPNEKLEINGNILLENGNQIIFSKDNGGSKDFGIKSDGEDLSIVETEESNKEYIRIQDDSDILIKPNGNLSTVFKKDGNVGIGTSSPDSKLTVKGGIEIYSKNRDGNNTDPFIIEKIEHSSDKNEFNINIGDNNGNDDYFTVSSKPSGNKTDLLTIRNNGRVGIGINNPYAQLHLKGDGRIRLDGRDNASYWDINAYDNGTVLNFVRNGSAKVTFHENGKVTSSHSTINTDSNRTLATKDYVDNNGGSSFSDCQRISRDAGNDDREYGKVSAHSAECKNHTVLTKITFTSHDNVRGINCCK